MSIDNEQPNKAKGGYARAINLEPEKRVEIAKKGAEARWSNKIIRATHGSDDHPLKISDIEIPCYVLEDGTRVLSQRGIIGGLGMSKGGRRTGGDRLVNFLQNKSISPYISNDLMAVISNPIKFRPVSGYLAYGYPATILADICDSVLTARKNGSLQQQQTHIADRCEILVRGFARVGIIALVDEATGYQKDRAANALAKILEAFIAKELQPWVKTFPADFYQELFRLRGLSYLSDSVQRPQYFGVLTNDIVYKRIAPGVLDELKKVTLRNEDGRPKHKYFQNLTSNVGYPKLREHLGSVVTLMKLSNDYKDFKNKLNKIHPPYGKTLPLPFEYEDDHDTGIGI